jgi:hypothetical protein
VPPPFIAAAYGDDLIGGRRLRFGLGPKSNQSGLFIDIKDYEGFFVSGEFDAVADLDKGPLITCTRGAFRTIGHRIMRCVHFRDEES